MPCCKRCTNPITRARLRREAMQRGASVTGVWASPKEPNLQAFDPNAVPTLVVPNPNGSFTYADGSTLVLKTGVVIDANGDQAGCGPGYNNAAAGQTDDTGRTILDCIKDGSSVRYADGTVQDSSGKFTFPDGSVLDPDGTFHPKGGGMVDPSGRYTPPPTTLVPSWLTAQNVAVAAVVVFGVLLLGNYTWLKTASAAMA